MSKLRPHSEKGGASKSSEDEVSPDELADLLHADLKLGAEAEPRKTLVLLDFNGTLVHRIKDNKIPRNYPPPDYTVRFSNYWTRPGAAELACILLNDPRCVLGVYTSIKAINMRSVIQGFDNVFEKKSKEGRFEYTSVYGTTVTDYSSIHKSGTWIFDREFNIVDPTGSKAWDTIRDLNRIWKDRRVNEEGFDSTNTIIVDAEGRKVRNWMSNAIVIEEWKGPSSKSDDVLMRLETYLDETVLTKMQQEDRNIGDILRETPFT